MKTANASKFRKTLHNLLTLSSHAELRSHKSTPPHERRRMLTIDPVLFSLLLQLPNGKNKKA